MENAYKILTIFIATVWLVNGLFCKILNLVPRHQQIVAEILGREYARPLTIAIGMAEIFMASWILSRITKRLCAIAQIIIVATMNTIEFFAVPDLLLWGKANAIFAFMFISLIYVNEFVLGKKIISNS
ncbi:DoxX-like family protein [Parapedobacter tibetensis]|uniref:DoxX-like family protein n=1 Tax=Parapedobacter tibetensis TaxID=2972951 RepID=UPI00214D7372|nr:DoxX-like family protein [Parapedobacter tibetensis]